MKRLIFFFTILLLGLPFSSCESDDFDDLPAPNTSLTAEEILNDIQFDFRDGLSSANITLMKVTRQMYQHRNYGYTLENNDAVAFYSNAYEILEGVTLLAEISAAQNGAYNHHLAMGQILQAMSFMYVVDVFGDVPYSQANNPAQFPNPEVDAGSQIYLEQLAVLDQAILNLNENASITPDDQYFGSFDSNNWIALANTLKLRGWLNMRLVDPTVAQQKIDNLLSQQLINTSNKDFEYHYETYDSNNPHPLYSRMGTFGNGIRDYSLNYMSNFLYDELNVGDTFPPFIEIGDKDPRANYYFYRQFWGAPSGSRLPCKGRQEYDYCYVGNYYWGRDHGDTDEFPIDGPRKTVFGVYPIGSGFDTSAFRRMRDTENQIYGAGILPLFLSSFTDFSLAEASLTLSIQGNTATYLESGIRKSFNKVKNSAEGLTTINPDTNIDYAINQQKTDTYVNAIMQEFNASSQADKLKIIAREYYIASYGNGLEAYNLYRRTGSPDLQSLIFQANDFPRSFGYPAEIVSSNPNITQHPITTQVFWDTNPAGFID